MDLTGASRILVDGSNSQQLRVRYWAFRDWLGRAARLGRDRYFARIVALDQWRFVRGSVAPVRGQTRIHADAALAWLLRAQAATPDDGVSLGYFPCDPAGPDRGWRPSYPETTGYIIQTILDYADAYGDRDLYAVAEAMARWEADVQMATGAIQGGPVAPAVQQKAAVFNTGMVLQGFTALLQREEYPWLREAARKAGDFLVADMGRDGHFRTHGGFVSESLIKTYNCLCAWALHRLGMLTGARRYTDAAVRTAEASAGQQQDNGWFAHNDLNRPEAPLTHTLGYTMQGLLEVGIAASRDDLVNAARRAALALRDLVQPDGFLHGRFFRDWRPAAFSECLTGSAQVAIVFYRLAAIDADTGWRTVADRIVDHLKALQVVDAPGEPIHGALAGSFPIFMGDYMTAGYPNWATKYLLDALLHQDGKGYR